MTKKISRYSLHSLTILLLGVIAVFLPRVATSTRTQEIVRQPFPYREIALTVNDLVYDPGTQRIYASVPSSVGGIGNSITQINPVSGTVGASIPIGSEPAKLAISDNSQYIYASLDGAAAVRRFDLATQTAGLQFSLGPGSPGSLYAEDIAVMPGQADTVAISRATKGVSPRHGGVVIYDNGVARPTTTASGIGSNSIEFSASASTLYGYDNEIGFGFRKMAVNSTGVSVVSYASDLINQPGVNIVHDNGLIYASNGTVVNPETATQVGTFIPMSATTAILADSSTNRFYCLTGNGTLLWTLRAFNQTTFTQEASLGITVIGTPSKLIKWGSNGLAFRTNSNRVFLVAISDLVPSGPTPIPSPIHLASGVVKLPLVTGDLVYDPNSQKFYVSLPSNSGSFGNSIATVVPETGAMTTPVFVGSEAGKLAISDSGHTLYAALNGAAAVRKFDTMSQTPGLQFALGLDQFFGTLYPVDLAVLPGIENSLAVSTRISGFSPGEWGVEIYDEGIRRPVKTRGDRQENVIEFSSLASTLYGINDRGSTFFKMNVDASGVSVVSEYNTGTLNKEIRYDNGLIFSTSGIVFNPENLERIGAFPGASGIMTSDQIHGRAYFLNSASLKVYDTNTFLQVGSFTIPQLLGNPAKLIKTPNGLALRTDNSIFFIPDSAIVPTPPTSIPTPVEFAPGIVQLPLATGDLIYDPNTQRVYASLPSSAGTFGNTIVSINPLTGTMGGPIFLGSEPGKLAIAPNNEYVYVGLNGAGAVRRFNLASQTVDLQFSVGGNNGSDPLFVDDMAVLPDNANAIAIARANFNASPRHRGVAIYDNGVMRPTNTLGSPFSGNNVIAFSTSASRLYGYSNEFAGSGFQRMAVNANGVSIISSVSGIITGSNTDIDYENGRVYSSRGQVIDPEAGTLLGSFPVANTLAFVPEARTNRAFFVTGSGGSTILQAYDVNTFVGTGFLNIPDAVGTPSSLIRWGADGLAFRTSGNQVFFVRTSLVPIITNPIDTASMFVRQHYLDFLNREPDPEGLAFWTNQITECQQPGAICSAEDRRVNASAAFFLSIEFQETGYLVYRIYKASYGDVAGTPVPVRFNEFLPDTQQIGQGVVVGVGNWQAVLEANKVAFALAFVSRSRFTTAYPTTLTPAQFVDTLFAKASVTPSASDRNAAINEFGGAGNTADSAARGRALRRVAENSIFTQQETNRAFVLMQYFGYLRRNPNDPPEAALNFDGYNFWLSKLNQFNGNFVNAEMVKAFIVSGEYRQRFGP